MTAYKSINPFTGDLLKEFPLHSNEELNQRIQELEKGGALNRLNTLDKRIIYIRKVQSKLVENKEKCAVLITTEMGKPIAESRAEIDKCISLCDYYTANAKGFLAPQKIVMSGAEVEVIYQPLGVVLAIMPWNFPFWQVFRYAIPTLLVGNTCLLKHAPNVPQCALMLEELFDDNKVFSNVFLSNEQVACTIKKDAIQGVTLTGSNRAGEIIGRLAGEQIKRVVLELGGNDAFVVLVDADLDRAVEKLVKSRFLNNGQSCIGAKRLLIDKSIKEKFVAKLIIEIEKTLIVGSPLLEETTMSVLARADLKENLHKQVNELVKAGGEVLYTQKIDEERAFFPVMLVDTGNLSTKDRDIELFGPVLQVNVFENQQEVVTFVNETSFGLGCSVWSKDLSNTKELSLLIDTGNVFINEMVFSSPYLPFGGVKKSGVGRELAKEGILEFTNVKTIYTSGN